MLWKLSILVRCIELSLSVKVELLHGGSGGMATASLKLTKLAENLTEACESALSCIKPAQSKLNRRTPF